MIDREACGKSDAAVNGCSQISNNGVCCTLYIPLFLYKLACVSYVSRSDYQNDLRAIFRNNVKIRSNQNTIRITYYANLPILFYIVVVCRLFTNKAIILSAYRLV